jgi:hypothetical protein
MSYLRLTPFRVLVAALAAIPVSLTGCGIGTMAAPDSVATITQPISGTIHGGPNPVVGAEVIMYATSSTAYGTGTQLQEATQLGTAAHQDTSSTGSFSFTGGYTCPAGSYAYIVAYGGNSGAGNNPNSVLMSALGPCSALFSGTTYTGGNIWIDELTTVASGYALSNFMTITGNSVGGYTVGIGADAMNSAAIGCVSNAYYGTTNCPTTKAAGLAHAFANAASLVNTTNGQVNASTTNGAVIPAQLISTLGNVIQACVNSTGGGTNGSGAPTTTTSSAGTSHDGTVCGRLSAYTSYTSNGTSTGTLTAAGNTLGDIQNLAKRPGGTVSTFDSACDSNSGSGTTSAATCIFNLASPTGFYQTAMTAAPPDWMLAIFYPKSSLSNAANTTTGCAGSPTNLGVLYPYMLATDINDNISILNGDGSTNVCYNLITVGFDGTPLAADQFDNTNQQLNWVANDSFGHTIVPVRPTSATTGGSVRIYSTGSDSTISLVNTVTSTTSATAADPFFVAVDGNDNIYVDSQAGFANGADFGYIFLNGANSHSAPAYTGGTISGYTGTSKGLQIAVDINNNIFTATSSGSGSTRPYFINAGGTSTFTEAPSTDEDGGSASNGAVLFPDARGNVWIDYTSSATDNAGTGVGDLAFGTSYTVASGAITYGSTPTDISPTTAVPAVDYKISPGAMDGNNVMWWSDQQGSSSATPIQVSYLHGLDTVNQDFLPMYYGCEFTTSASTACGSLPTDTTGSNTYPSSYPYALFSVRGLAVDSAGDIWTANGSQNHITEIIGMAAPTWPLFYHNGSSLKP